MCIKKALITIDRLKTLGKSFPFDKIKQLFFKAAAKSVLL